MPLHPHGKARRSSREDRPCRLPPRWGPESAALRSEVHEAEKERQTNRKPDHGQVDTDMSVMDLPEDAANRLFGKPSSGRIELYGESRGTAGVGQAIGTSGACARAVAVRTEVLAQLP